MLVTWAASLAGELAENREVRLVKINDNFTKRLIYFRFYGNLLQIFELREVRIEKRKILCFSRTRLDYKLRESK